MVLASANRALHQVLAVVVGQHQLVFNSFVLEEILEDLGDFIVQALVEWSAASIGESRVDDFIGLS